MSQNKKMKSSLSNFSTFMSGNGFAISAFAFVTLTALVLFKDEEKFTRFKKLFSSKQFIASTLLILVFSSYMLNLPIGNNKDVERLKTATKEGLLGFLIAVLAYLDLKAAPFWIIWLTSYYLNV